MRSVADIARAARRREALPSRWHVPLLRRVDASGRCAREWKNLTWRHSPPRRGSEPAAGAAGRSSSHAACAGCRCRWHRRRVRVARALQRVAVRCATARRGCAGACRRWRGTSSRCVARCRALQAVGPARTGVVPAAHAKQGPHASFAAAAAQEAAAAPESAAAAAAAPEVADAAPAAAPADASAEQEAAAEAPLPAPSDEPADSDSDSSGFELLPSPPREIIEILDSQPSQEPGAAGRAASPPRPPRDSSQGRRRQRSPGEAATQCDICYEALSSSGEHVPVALRCGHVFGQRCVRKWMSHSGATPACPNCKTRLVPGEELRLFASTGGVIVVDRSAATAAEHAAAQADAAAAQARAELAEARRQLQQLQEQQQRTGAAGWPAAGVSFGGAAASAPPRATQLSSAPPATHALHKSFRMQHLSCCDLLGDALVAGSATLSPPAPRLVTMQLDGGLAISALQLRSSGALPSTDFRVRDVRLGRAPQSHSALALACMPGRRLVLLDLAAGGEASSVELPAQPLCCAWAADGTDQGALLVFPTAVPSCRCCFGGLGALLRLGLRLSPARRCGGPSRMLGASPAAGGRRRKPRAPPVPLAGATVSARTTLH